MSAQQAAQTENIVIPPPGTLENLPATTAAAPNQTADPSALPNDPNPPAPDPNQGANINTGAPTEEEREKNHILRKYFSQAVETPEERARKDAQPPDDANPFTLRRFMHENITQSIPAKTPPPQPNQEPLTERVTKKKEPKDGRSLWQRIKDSFKKGSKDTSPPKRPEGNGAVEPARVDEASVVDVQGPDPEPAK